MCVCAQTVVSLLQTTLITSDVCFVTDHVFFASSNKTKIVESRRKSSFYPGWMRLLFTCVLGRYAASTVILVPKLQALVYDILPSTTAVFSYAIGPRKVSANEQFFVGVQTVVSLLQTTQIKQGVSFIAANKVNTGTNKTTIV